MTCPACAGRGENADQSCPACHGTGLCLNYHPLPPEVEEIARMLACIRDAYDPELLAHEVATEAEALLLLAGKVKPEGAMERALKRCEA